MNVTLRDLAREAGVSPSTVSRVLRNSPKVHPTSQDKVYRAVKSMGYRHNPLVDAWATRFRETHRQSGMVLAHVVGFSQEEINHDPVLSAVSRSVLRRAADLDISVSSFVLKDGGDLDASRLRSILFHRGIGAVLWGPFPALAAIETAVNWDISIIGIGNSHATQHLHRAVHNRYLSMLHLCECLQAFQRPGLVGFGPKGSSASHGWVQAYGLHVAKHLKHHQIPWLALPTMDRRLFGKWFDRFKPDVVISPLLELQNVVEDKGCVFLGLNLVEDGSCSCHRGVTHPSAAIGRGAVDLLLAQCDLNETGFPDFPRQTAWEGTLAGVRNEAARPIGAGSLN